MSKFYGQGLESERLLVHRDTHIGRQHNTAVKTFYNVVETLSGAKGEQLRELLPEVARRLGLLKCL